MNNIVFVGGFFPKWIEEDIQKKSKTAIQNSSNVFQWGLINGIEESLKSSITLITAPFIGYYPTYYSDMLFKTIGFSHAKNSKDISVGFCNLPFIKNIHKYFRLLKYLKIWYSKNKGNKIIIVYSMNLAYLKAVVKLKKRYPELKICLVVTDLPEFPADSGLIYKYYISHIERPEVYKLLSKVDSFVFLTDKMASLLNVNKCPWVRIEGIYDSSLEIADKVPKENFKTILYSGVIDNRYGIKELLTAFNLIKSSDYRLWICGTGISQSFVEKSQIDDSRIKYFGNLPRQKVLELQRMATVLINPRNTIGEYNEYSFPSKTMEYLASGTPAIIYKLPGIPEEYFNHCFVVPDNSIETLASSIVNICELNPTVLKEKGELARNFILRNKNPKIQCDKAVDMIYSLYK